MGEEILKESKILNANEAPTVRELVDFVNTYNIPREDIVTMLPSKEGYILIYYY